MNIDIIARGIASRAVRPDGENELVSSETGQINLLYSPELQALTNAFGSLFSLTDYAQADITQVESIGFYGAVLTELLIAFGAVLPLANCAIADSTNIRI